MSTESGVQLLEVEAKLSQQNTESGILLFIPPLKYISTQDYSKFNDKQEEVVDANNVQFNNTVFGTTADVSFTSSINNFEFNSEDLFKKGKHGNDSRIDPLVLNSLLKFILTNIYYLQHGGSFYKYSDILDYKEGSIVYDYPSNLESVDTSNTDDTPKLYQAVVRNGPNLLRGVVRPCYDSSGTWVPFMQVLTDQVTSGDEVNYLRSQISALRELLNIHETSINDLQKENRKLNTISDDLSTRVESVTTQANNTQVVDANQDKSISNLDTKSSKNTTDLEELRSLNNTMKSTLNTYDVKINALENKIKDLEEQIALLKK